MYRSLATSSPSTLHSSPRFRKPFPFPQSLFLYITRLHGLSVARCGLIFTIINVNQKFNINSVAKTGKWASENQLSATPEASTSNHWLPWATWIITSIISYAKYKHKSMNNIPGKKSGQCDFCPWLYESEQWRLKRWQIRCKRYTIYMPKKGWWNQIYIRN